MRRVSHLGNGVPRLRRPRPSETGTGTIATTLANHQPPMQPTAGLDIAEACAGWDTYVQASPLAPVPQPHNTIVGGTCGQQVVAICLQAV